MQKHATDPGVFIRSMATRGYLGGLSRATNDAIDLMDAAGYDPVLVETVGVGQDEVDVVKTADTVAVVSSRAWETTSRRSRRGSSRSPTCS